MANAVSSLTARNHLLFWGGAFAVFLTFVWIFSAVLLPFVLGLAIAYLLDPMVEHLGNHKIPRGAAALIILGLFFLFVFSALALIMPPLYRESAQLATDIPGYTDKIISMLSPYIDWLQGHFGNGDLVSYQETLQNNIGKALTIGINMLTGLASGGQAFAGFISVMIITPVTAFFMMKDWNVMTGWADNLIPRRSYKTVKSLLEDINKKLSGFVRGQLSIAFALAIIYAIALTIAGLKFGFLIGLMAGILSIIPLVGSTIGLFASVIIAWFQAGEWEYVAIIAAIFMTGQFIEGNFLTPKLLGKSVGLHPLWILFSLLAGGSMFGITGMLLAVPVAATIGVLLGFIIKEYKDSPYYKPRPKEKLKKKK